MYVQKKKIITIGADITSYMILMRLDLKSSRLIIFFLFFDIELSLRTPTATISLNFLFIRCLISIVIKIRFVNVVNVYEEKSLNQLISMPKAYVKNCIILVMYRNR